MGPYLPVVGFHASHCIGVIARSRGNDIPTTRLRFAGILTSITVSDRAPSASSVSPAPMLAFSPARESMPTIRKSSSPYCPLGSRMSPEFGSSALMVLSRAFFDVLHCHAPPVAASASAANKAASERAASSIGRRRDLGFGARVLAAFLEADAPDDPGGTGARSGSES